MPAGLYNYEQLSKFLIKEIPTLMFEINKETRKIVLYISEMVGKIKLSGEMRRILGIDEMGWISEEYVGDRPVEFITPRLFHIYLDQLSTTSNLVDGAPSTLLAIIPVATGGVVDINPHYPMYKKLVVGHIHQLNLSMLDENGTIMQNRGTTVLEIRENAQAANGATCGDDRSEVDISYTRFARDSVAARRWV